MSDHGTPLPGTGSSPSGPTPTGSAGNAATIPRAGAALRLGESGRTMRIMLSTKLEQLIREKPRTVVVKDVPWELFDVQSARARCEGNHGQTIEEISRRGGFDSTEAIGVLTGLTWGELRNLREDHAHRMLYQMIHLYRRGVLTGAQGIEARRVETLGSTCESPVASGHAPDQSPHRTQDHNTGGED